MYIHEAITARTRDEPFITRQSWVEDYGAYAWQGSKILPTNTPDCCLVQTRYSRTPCRGWQPRAADLLADDWITVP